ncbi:family 16 glycosylhydrolase [Flammeovirga yaeyamensis]|uniref:Family 16 glycosylhydrolase n=1 Tax=Flammeovirga yaeyamensis TaxID=367791 RepID=A0AAX1NAU3_9BACT|nr:family 16 glycosylhydrolase [Flammeovirga yaeyamensis]MBB3699939.1 beta-glucanase (GH16 family) [Flammeovirga yaeyamensis]NMF37622.1 family 16 glycosylhydrolase [Flammeovirga yaeyamensis]QWG04678.1 family 16 glycosylhydrolase [Flammeovirga yaeyamensis]
MLPILGLVASISTTLAQTPVSHPFMEWKAQEEMTDEFENMDQSKWNNDPNDWGVWSWDPSLAYVEDGELKIKMIQETHRRNTDYGQNEELYYKSGIIRNYKPITYGYFEARIKGADRFPGVSPAFWLYSINQPDPTEDGQAKYCEIDVVELTQREWSFETGDWEGPEAIDMNLHAVARENGELIQIRPHKTPEIAQNKWYADFDPRDDYHTYGVLNRADSIIWYVDGIERGRKENLYWHLPMYVTVSMGLRSPFVKYDENGVRKPVPEETTTEGFPTEMLCSYVRVWESDPQVVMDKAYEGKEFGKDRGMNFNVYFDAGSGYRSTYQMDFELQERDTNGDIVEVVATSQAILNGRSAGDVVGSFNLQNVELSASLEDGHYYTIDAIFNSTKDENEEVRMTSPVAVKIVDQVTSIDTERQKNVVVYPNPSNNLFKIKGVSQTTPVQVMNIIGEVLIDEQIEANKAIDISNLVNGVYFVRVNIDGQWITKRLVKN